MQMMHKWRHLPNDRFGSSAGCKATGAKGRGLEYHRRVYRALRKIYGFSQEEQLLIEPWYREESKRGTLRSPDAVLIDTVLGTGLVIEVKLNWKDGRDVKLIDEYLPIVRSAHQLDVVWPVLITKCLRGYEHPPLLGLQALDHARSWMVGEPTPVLLHV